MLDKDTLIQKTLLAISPDHINRYAQLPTPVQNKIKDIIFQLAEHHQLSSYDQHTHELDDDWDEATDQITSLFTSSLQSHDGVLPLSHTKSIIASDDRLISSSNDTSNALQKHINAFPENAYTDDLEVLPDGNLKLEITSTRESLYAGIGCLGPIILFIGFMSEISMFYYIGIFAFIWGTRQASRTDDFLKFVPEKSEIFYHRQNGKKISLTSYLKLDEVLYIAVQGSQNSSKESSWWEYKPVAITTRGEFLNLGDEKKSDYLTCFAFSRQLAEMFNVNFFNEFEPEAKLEVMSINSELRVYYTKND
tara:strand:- start:188 stop:1108 length:921 start_codon:yes stop_codon:yes gene_type:complete